MISLALAQFLKPWKLGAQFVRLTLLGKKTITEYLQSIAAFDATLCYSISASPFRPGANA